MIEDEIEIQGGLDACLAFNSHDKNWSPEMKDLEKAFTDGAHWVLSHQWISAKDRLPENDDNVIIHCSGGYTGVYWYCKDDNIFIEAWGDNSDDVELDAVDYWMPIPKIAEGEK